MSSRKKTVEPAGELLTSTRELLRNRPAWLTLQRIERETQLPYAWLLTLHRDDDCRPAVNRVEHLNRYLKIRTAKGEYDQCLFPLN